MKIKQILNNNAVLLSKGSNEVVAVSNGIGFKRKVGDFVDETEVDKIFVLDTHELVEHFSYLLNKVPQKHIAVVFEIVAHAESILGRKMNDYIYLALIDHLDYAIRRYRDGVAVRSPLSWEVKHLYKVEFEIGLFGLNVINTKLDLEMDEEEAVMIGLHFVNTQSDDKNMQQTLRATGMIQDILNIVKYQFKIELDESSINYMRFVTHLKFFVQRVLEYEEPTEMVVNELHNLMKNLYRDAYNCVQSIALYLFENFNRKITQDEEVYLMIHINRVTQREV